MKGRILKTCLGVLVGTMLFGTVAFAAESDVATADVSMVLYSNSETELYIEPSSDTSAVVISKDDFPDGAAIQVTGITSNGFFRIELNGTYYIPAIGLQETAAIVETAESTTAEATYDASLAVAPSDTYVISRLQMISTITEIQAVTEDNDPNGKLNKSGGYIGAIYFTDSQVDRSKVYIEEGDDVVGVGTEGGGCVEIYSNTEDAENRNAYLGIFDGTIFDSGSHCVVGTLVIRTSTYLTATQQQTLTNEIISAITLVQ